MRDDIERLQMLQAEAAELGKALGSYLLADTTHESTAEATLVTMLVRNQLTLSRTLVDLIAER